MKRFWLMGWPCGMKVAICLLLSLAVLDSVEAIGRFAPKNPEYLKWKKRRLNPTNVIETNKVTRTMKALPKLSALTLSQESDSEVDVPTNLLDVAIDSAIPPLVDFSYLRNQNVSYQRGGDNGSQIRFDPRPDGVTAVRHQDPNNEGIGTCWAQASIGSIETWLAKQGEEYSFSVRNLVNLCDFGDYSGHWMSSVWNGGNWLMSSAYLLGWKGPILEADDPYTDDAGQVRLNYNSEAFTPQVHIQQTRIIPARNDSSDNAAIKRAIQMYGGAYVCMNLCSYTNNANYWGYHTWNPKVPGAYYYWGEGAGHAVTVVGWDDGYSRTNFKYKPKGDGAFIVKDSYGNKPYRDSGYLYVSYYDTSFASEAGCAFPYVEDNDNYAKVYQHDPYGMVGTWGIGESYTKCYGANMFTATADEEISAVGFYALVANQSYKIYVYTGCEESKPRSGTCVINGQFGTTEQYAGYYTIPLSSTVSVSKGQRFSVVVYLNAPGSGGDVYALEYAESGYSDNAKAAAGQSFFSLDGSNWYDFTLIESSCNFCCKAYTKSETGSAKTLQEIYCVSEDKKYVVAPGKTKKFICMAKYSDGTESAVSAIWSTTTGTTFGTIDSSSGLFSAKSSASKWTEVVVGIHAKYQGKTSDEVSVTVTDGRPNTPENVTATSGDEASCVRLSWTGSSRASNYAIYRGKGSNLDASKCGYLASTENTKYADNDATPGVTFTYRIKACNENGNSSYSLGASGWRALAAPETVMASDGTSTEYVRITWSEVTGAGAYRVYRSETDEEEDATPLGDGWQTEIGYDDETAVAGTVYYYWVKSAVDTSGTRPSALGVGDSGIRQKLIVPEKLLIYGAASVTSGGQESYTAKLKYSDGQYAPVTPTWTLNGASTTVASYSYAAPIVSASTDVLLGASFTTNGVEYTATQKIMVSPSVPAAPSAPSITSADASGVSLSWTAVAGASSYVIYRGTTTDAESAEKVGTASGTTYTDKGSIPGQTVYYFIAAANTAGTGSRSAASASAMRSLAAPTGVTASNGTYTDKVRVTWNSVLGATHYRVSRATSATGAQTDLGTVWATETTFDDDTAEAGTTYWYFVRAATSSAGANASVKSAGVQGVCKLVVVPTGLTITGPDRVNASGKAVYAATATFSVGSPAPVAATFSTKSGSGASITEAGSLTADAVTVDAEVEIEASFTQNGETITATKTVRILAPKAATVSVSNVKATSRWPWSGIIDIDYTIATDPAGKKAAVSVSGFDNDHQKPVAASTLTGDGATGPVAEGEHRISWDLAVDHPGFNAASFSVDVSASIASLDAPTGLTASNGTSADAVNLGWNAVDDAESYQVWRGTNETASAAEKIATVTGTTYADTNATALVTYYYWISAAGSYGESEKSETAVSGTRKLAAPTNVSATNGSSSDQVTVSWTASPSATSYEIWRSTSNSSSSAEKIGTATSNSYPDTKAVAGTTYYYWVKAVGPGGTSAFSSAGSGKRKKIATSIAITGDGSVKAGCTATYTCTAYYNNDTHATVTPTWSISSGSSYGSITSAGVLTANGTSVARSVTVKASYTYNGVSVTPQTKTISITTFTVTITFDANGGTVSPASKSYTAYGTYGALPTAVLTGINFAGWFTADGMHVTTATAVPSCAITLYARWGYLLTFNKQGGTGGSDSACATNGVALPSITRPTRDGYGFGGYFTGASFGGTQYYSSACTGTVWQVGASRDLYASWIENVTGFTGTVQQTGIQLKWNSAGGAKKYLVYVAPDRTGGTDSTDMLRRLLRYLNWSNSFSEGAISVNTPFATTTECSVFHSGGSAGTSYRIVPFRDENSVGKWTDVTVE